MKQLHRRLGEYGIRFAVSKIQIDIVFQTIPELIYKSITSFIDNKHAYLRNDFYAPSGGSRDKLRNCWRKQTHSCVNDG